METLLQEFYTRFSMVTKSSHILGATRILQNSLLIKVSTNCSTQEPGFLFNIRQPYDALLLAVHNEMWRIERKLHAIFSCLLQVLLIAIFLSSPLY